MNHEKKRKQKLTHKVTLGSYREVTFSFWIGKQKVLAAVAASTEV